MKPRRKLLTLVLIAMLAIPMFQSCDDLLNRKPYDGLIKNEFWQSEEDVRAAVMGCYNQLQSDGCLGSYIAWGDVRADMLVVDKGNDIKELNEQIISQYNNQCNWKPFYVAINRANTVIENAPAAQEIDGNFSMEELEAMLAECYFMRALSYFYLVRTFKEVPLITASYATDDQEYYFPKNTISDIYAQIIDDNAGQTLVSASTIDKELRTKMEGLTKVEQAKLVGKAVAERASTKGIETVVFDRGGYRYIGRVKALADGAREGGLKF